LAPCGVIRNTRNQPVMPFAIRHEATLPVGVANVCHASMAFSKPMMAAGETKTIDANLARRRIHITPVIDFVPWHRSGIQDPRRRA